MTSDSMKELINLLMDLDRHFLVQSHKLTHPLTKGIPTSLEVKLLEKDHDV